MNTKITKDLRYVGVNDHSIDLFEGQYTVPNGMAYNSYVILDDKIAVMDSVDARYATKWLANIQQVIGDKTPDYLIVQHMEPDHSSSVTAFAKQYPDAVIVSSDKAFTMMGQFFGTMFSDRRLVIQEGDSLCLGHHELTFVAAPMVHWPEVMMTYDRQDRVLFSADAFGKFGALDVDEPWEDEACRYYIGIVGKYGAQVQKVLAKAAQLDIAVICPLHGPILSENLGEYLHLYQMWSSYTPRLPGVLVAYTSVYGNTKQAVAYLVEQLQQCGIVNVVAYDLARCDMAKVIGEAFQYEKMIVATTTYNGDMFPYMRQFLDGLAERNYQNRVVGIIENGSWAPCAAKKIKDKLAECKNVALLPEAVTIRSAMNENNQQQIRHLAEQMASAIGVLRTV